MKTVEPVSQKMIEKVKTGIDQHLEEKQLRKSMKVIRDTMLCLLL